MGESTATADKRFAKLGIPETVDARRRWRELIVTTPGLGTSISAAILYDETIRQSADDGTPFVQLLERAGIVPGIKVDEGRSRWRGFRERRSPKAWTDFATALWTTNRRWSPEHSRLPAA